MSHITEMQEFARVTQRQLDHVPPALWAVWFVECRLTFARLFGRGVCSTAHGPDFFRNVLAGPEHWNEPGDYGENFRNLFK